jgi:hypothetical protein
MLILAFPLIAPIAVGLVVTVAASQVAPVVRALRSRAVLVAGRVVLIVMTAVLLPGAALDIRDIVN